MNAMVQRSKDEKKILIAFGQHLRELRRARGLTQEELAHLAGFSRSYYTEVETGKRNIALLNLHRLARCLDVRLADMLDVNGQDDEH